MVQTKRVFSEDDLSSAFVEAPTNFKFNSLKTECCSGENVLAVLPKVLECFRTVYKMKTAIYYISSLDSWVALALVLEVTLSLLSTWCRSTRRISMEPFNRL